MATARAMAMGATGWPAFPRAAPAITAARTAATTKVRPMATTTATRTAPRVTRPRFTTSARLRLTPYFLLLALPLAIGVWAFGNFAAQNARERADTQLRASLTAAGFAYRQQVATAAAEARALPR